MKEKLTTFERRMKILAILINQPIVSRLELSRRFSVSTSTICEDVISLCTVVPIASKMGRYGGIYLIDEYKRNQAYLSREEESLLVEISKKKIYLII